MKSPVLFLIFNRPDTTAKVFEEIRKAQPPRLYVAADGPRANRSGEKKLCEETRSIATKVDWDCEVKTLFRDKNLGCGKAVSQAITWFFDNEPEGIILEDDIIPHPDFFPYCDELLEMYRNNEDVGMIGGHNLMYGKYKTSDSYTFMTIGHIWGWASWRRAWKHFYYQPASIYPYSIFREKLKTTFKSIGQCRYWEHIYKSVENGISHTWDYQWTIALIYNGLLCVVPYVNLTKNIGFNSNSTHTSSATEEELNVIPQPILPIKHPKEVKQNMDAEEIERVNSKMYISSMSNIKKHIKRSIKYVIYFRE